MSVEFHGHAIYHTTAPYNVQNGNQLVVRVPNAVLPVDENRNLSVRITVAGRHSPVYRNGLSMANPLTITAVHGCVNDTGNSTGLCAANQTVTVSGSGFTLTSTRLMLVSTYRSPPCQYVNTSTALCILPTVISTGFNYMRADVQSGDLTTAKSLPGAVQSVITAHLKDSRRLCSSIVMFEL